MDRTKVDDFLDLLYDATLEPGLWVPAMERFADLLGGDTAVLSELDMETGRGGGMIARIDPLIPEIYFEHYAQRNPLSNVTDPAGYLRGWSPKILTDEDWMAKDALLASEYYNDFLRPQDIHSVLMIRLARSDSTISVLNISRPRRLDQFGTGEIDLAGRLHRHLIRAYGLSRKFAAVHEVKEGLATVLDRSAHGVFLLDETGVVRHANKAARTMTGEGGGLRLMGGRLTAAAPDAARRLQGMIAAAVRPADGERVGGSMAVPLPSGQTPLSLMVAPLRSDRFQLVRERLMVMVCVTDPRSAARLPQQILRDLFGLTPAEARVAMALFEGRTSKEAAETLGVSFHTVRVQLARIFDKTQTRRQADLVRLMMGAVGVDAT